jgi:hypothetical protein
MPKTMALFQLTGPPSAGRPNQAPQDQKPLLKTTYSSNPSALDMWDDQLPPDSDSDSDDSDPNNGDLTANERLSPAPSTKIRPTFTPFSDPSIGTIPKRQENSPPKPPSTVSLAHSNVEAAVKPSPTSFGVVDENASSIQALERKYKKAERDVIVAIGNMHSMSEEAGT